MNARRCHFHLLCKLSRSLAVGITLGIAAGIIVLSTLITLVSPQTPAGAASTPAAVAPRTPWGEPDLQGIWTDETDIPLQRLAKYGTRNFSPTPNAPKSIVSGRDCLPATGAPNAAPKPMSPPRTIRCSSP